MGWSIVAFVMHAPVYNNAISDRVFVAVDHLEKRLLEFVTETRYSQTSLFLKPWLILSTSSISCVVLEIELYPML